MGNNNSRLLQQNFFLTRELMQSNREFRDIISNMMRLNMGLQMPPLERFRYNIITRRDNKMGYCLLINNSLKQDTTAKLTSKTNRQETVKNLDKWLKELQFNVETLTNIQINGNGGLRKALKNTAVRSRRYSCVVIAIISPGVIADGGIRLSDRGNNQISLTDVWTPFMTQQAVPRTPKLFFLEIVGSGSGNTDLDPTQYPGEEEKDILIAHSSGGEAFLERLPAMMPANRGGSGYCIDVVSALEKAKTGEDSPAFTYKSTLESEVFIN